MAEHAYSTPAPSVQDAALEELFHQYELIHAYPLESEVSAVLGQGPISEATRLLLAPFFPRWGGEAGEPTMAGPPPRPLQPTCAMEMA